MTTTKPTGTHGYSYVRVSNDDQDKSSQRKAVQKWLDARTLKVIETVEDAGSRDLSYKRTGFQHLLQQVQAGKVDWIVVAERDRFGVSDNEEWGYFITILRRHNCQLWSVADDKELTSRKDRSEPFMAAITSDRSRSEQEARGQRDHRNKHALVQRGAWPGGRPPRAYDLVCRENATGQELWRMTYQSGQHRRVCFFPDGSSKRFDGKGNTNSHNRKIETIYAELSKDPVLVEWVRKIFQWFADGYSYRGIATQLNSLKVPAVYTGNWLGVTIKGLLKNPIYSTGVPTWNKKAHGRFVELVGGEWVPVERDNGCGGRIKGGRKRTAQDHVSAPAKPENAIIAQDLWNTVQARIRALETAPKKERRPRNPELYLTGLAVCDACDSPMVAWSQHESYKCATNSAYAGKCRCNKTRHSVLEGLVEKYLDDVGRSLELFNADPEQCWALVELGLSGEPLLREYHKGFARMLGDAKKAGLKPPATAGGGQNWTYRSLRSAFAPVEQQQTEGLEAVMREKEQERGRLAKRLGLVADDAVQAVADRLAEVTAELRVLREKARPVTDRLDQVREQCVALLERTREARRFLAESLPRQKGEAVRRTISQIRVKHEERMMGKLRASRLVEVVIVPAVGEPTTFRPEDQPGRG